MTTVQFEPVNYRNVCELMSFSRGNPESKLLEMVTRDGIKTIEDPVDFLQLQQAMAEINAVAVASTSFGIIVGYIRYTNAMKASLDGTELRIDTVVLSPHLPNSESNELREALVAHAREVSGW